jgi:predicted ATPase
VSTIQTLAVQNYRTLREFIVGLGAIQLVTGPNGSGKSNIYKALRLLADTAQGGVVATLAREGGLASTLWAGPEEVSPAMRRGDVPVQGTRRKQVVTLGLGFACEDFGYQIDLGLPQPTMLTQFNLDPVIKGEYVWSGPVARPAALLVERRGAMVRARKGRSWEVLHQHLPSFDSMMPQVADPRGAPELLALRERIRSWRFYDHFRSDAAAPARQPQVGTHTPVLGHDGADLAAAWQTIREIGDPKALNAAVDDAFPGAEVDVAVHDGRFEILMQQPGLLRPLRAMELSDGTLRYLLWIAALLSPRPPALLVLNEPETSLHPDRLPALGRLIAQAATRAQVFVVSHASRLVATLEALPQCQSFTLEKELGETRVMGLHDLERPPWHWVAR